MSGQDAKRKLRSSATMANIGGSSFPAGSGRPVEQRLQSIERAIAAIGRAIEHLADVVDELEADVRRTR